MSYRGLTRAAQRIFGEGASVDESNVLRVPGREAVSLPATDTGARLHLEAVRRHGFEWLLESVEIARHPGDDRGCDVPVHVLSDPHLRTVSGGDIAVNPGGQPMLYARMLCTDLPADADFGHSCRHGPPPHDILVWVPKGRGPTIGYQRLREIAEHRNEWRTLVFSPDWPRGSDRDLR